MTSLMTSSKIYLNFPGYCVVQQEPQNKVPPHLQRYKEMNAQTELTVELYMKTLEEKGTEAAKKLVLEAFGEEGSEGFNEEAFTEFSGAAIAEMISRNNKWAEDIRMAGEATVEEDNKEEEAKS